MQLLSFLFAIIMLLCHLCTVNAGKGKQRSLPRAVYMKAHNKHRVHYQALPVTYHDPLYKGTKQWAEQCKMVHSKGSYGENLAAVGSAPKAPGVNFDKHAMSPWMSEASAHFAGTGGATGHFTQVVWKGSRGVACVAASCPKGTIFKEMASTFYVCRYAKQGNIIGQFDKNVGKYRR